jgi:hypothetical protein
MPDAGTRHRSGENVRVYQSGRVFWEKIARAFLRLASPTPSPQWRARAANSDRTGTGNPPSLRECCTQVGCIHSLASGNRDGRFRVGWSRRRPLGPALSADDPDLGCRGVRCCNVVRAQRALEGSRHAKTAIDPDTRVHQFPNGDDLVARSTKAQQSFEYLTREICRQHAGQNRRPACG